ncbi:uncharacterized protein TNCV_1998531 [Trichonephila clavipes]|nr:uncharacterized protein TNCV_1998531 [Trichonephila clavipes]
MIGSTNTLDMKYLEHSSLHINHESLSLQSKPRFVFKEYGTSLPSGLATRGLLATDHVILNHGQVMWTIPELAPPLLTTTPHQLEDVSALDRFDVHRCPTRQVFSGIGLELVTRQATIRYLYHSATAATPLLRHNNLKQGWATRGTCATVWHGRVVTVTSEDLLKNLKT